MNTTQLPSCNVMWLNAQVICKNKCVMFDLLVNGKKRAKLLKYLSCEQDTNEHSSSQLSAKVVFISYHCHSVLLIKRMRKRIRKKEGGREEDRDRQAGRQTQTDIDRLDGRAGGHTESTESNSG